MLKEIFHKETFIYFVENWAFEDLIVRGRSGGKASKLFLFDLSGFALFYVFVALAKTVYSGAKIDQSDLVGPMVFYVSLLCFGGVFFFLLRLCNVSTARIFDLYDKVIFTLLLALAAIAIDRFFSNYIFEHIESATCSILFAKCGVWLGMQKTLIAMIYAAIGILILLINTWKLHIPALRLEPELRWPVIRNCALTIIVAMAVVSFFLRAFVLIVT